MSSHLRKCELFGQGESSTYLLNRLGPAGDDAGQRELDGLARQRAVKDGAVGEGAVVVDFGRRGLGRSDALSLALWPVLQHLQDHPRGERDGPLGLGHLPEHLTPRLL